jgi:hypothetical protein
MAYADFVANKAAEWRRRADDYERDGLHAAAAIYRRAAGELEADHAAFLDERLSASQAEAESGFSALHIRLLRAHGVIGDTRRDLPRKPGHGVAHGARPTQSLVPSLTEEVLAARQQRVG